MFLCTRVLACLTDVMHIQTRKSKHHLNGQSPLLQSSGLNNQTLKRLRARGRVRTLMMRRLNLSKLSQLMVRAPLILRMLLTSQMRLRRKRKQVSNAHYHQIPGELNCTRVLLQETRLPLLTLSRSSPLSVMMLRIPLMLLKMKIGTRSLVMLVSLP